MATSTRIPQAICHVLCLLLLGLLLVGETAVHAQGIESIMAPGKLMQDHAKYEDDCKQCHVRLDRKAQDGLCMACHKEVGADVRAKAGFHGRLEQPTPCKTCHTDHKGRELKTTGFDHKTFEHNKKTDFTLRGKHDKVACEKCHVTGKKFREAAQDCNSCHKKDDKHKGQLGPKCADCHTESDWKEARFDHDTTRFPLTGKHVDTKCTDCHKDNVYKDTPTTCYACHRKVDEQKGHKGQFGEKCDTCHGTKAWKPANFNHDTDTKYVLKGKHHDASCKSCHSGNLYKDKLSQDCYACHKKDDKHKETQGTNCAACHVEKDWKEVGKFNHQKTDFPLLGKHAKVECKECHKSQVFKDAAKDCYSCHKKDDKHKDTLGHDCASCHGEQGWKNTSGRFRHERTRFALRNAHAAPGVECSACHKDLVSFRNTPVACISCHKKDDEHQTQLGEKCDSCHSDKSWRGTTFNHGKSRFPLTGRHILTECSKCHATLRYKDAPRDCFSCHKNEDKHKQVLGVRCESCHNTRAWSTWSFDHDNQTQYRLEFAHAKAACESCHKRPAPAGKDIAPLGTACVSCHRSQDVHNGGFGPRCEQCHLVESWKKVKSRVGQGALP
ncbi:cytochrome C [Rhodoferax sp. GW822-FHT02A01]|uniref:cytochrome C n=1 Tax=Rhodoferax sp. GW822-FHT02A01 TaxID=3141537 RepID=UPI00315CFB9A